MRSWQVGALLALASGPAQAWAAAKGEAASPGLHALTVSSAGSAAASLPNIGPTSEEVKMKAFQAEAEAIKERIYNSKARLLVLQQTVLHGAAAGAVARIDFKNEIGNAYRLDSATWVLDGQTIFAESSAEPPPPGGDAKGARPKPGTVIEAPEQIAAEKEKRVFDGAIIPGNHTLSVTLIYKGNGYQVFNYLEGYRFTVQSTYSFVAEEGKTTEVEAHSVPKDALSHSYEDRLDMRFDVSTKDSVPIPAGVEARP